MSEHIVEFPEDEVIEVLFNDVIVTGAEPPSGTISITENGSYNITDYAEASVNVPQGVFPIGSLSITQNGSYDVTNYAGANVNVPQGVFPTGSLSITQNGSYDVTNYAGANVNVPKVPDNMEIIPIQLTEDTTNISFDYTQNKTIKLIIIACYENNLQIRNAMHSVAAMNTYGGSTPYMTLSLRNGYNYLPLSSGTGDNFVTCTIDDINKNIAMSITAANIMFRKDFEYTAYVYYEDT